MQMIRTNLGKSKKRKPTAHQREMRSEWEAMLKKYATKTVDTKSKNVSKTYSPAKSTRSDPPRIPSLPFTGGPCLRAPDKVYTGTAIVGIATMHKSNAVPVFSNEEAIEISKMRRG